MNLLKTIKIGNLTYSITVIDKFNDSLNTIGHIEKNSSSIRLADNYLGDKFIPSVMVECLMHEIFHALDFHYLDCHLSENYIDAFSRAWIQVIADNDINFKKIDHIPQSLRIAESTYTVKYPADPANETCSELNYFFDYSLRIFNLYETDSVRYNFSSELLRLYLIEMINSVILEKLKFDDFLTIFSNDIHSDGPKKIFSFALFNLFLDNPKLESLIKKECGNEIRF